MEFKDCYRILGVAELTADLIEVVALLRRRLHTPGDA
jgi:hypothetical protein